MKTKQKDIEIINPKVRGDKVKCVIFDFDGTISILREGWPEVMKEIMIESVYPEGNPTKKDVEKIKEFIDKTTGIETIHQMQGLAKMVSERGIKPKTDKEYKKIYLDRLYQKKIYSRLNQNFSPEKFIISGAVDFLNMLKNKKLTIIAASGTDRADVEREAKLIGVARFFNGGIFGSLENYEDFNKGKLIKELIETKGFQGDEIMVIGDGPVELTKAKENNCIAIGIAPDEIKGKGWNMNKRKRVFDAGADIIIPDFECGNKLLKYLKM